MANPGEESTYWSHPTEACPNAETLRIYFNNDMPLETRQQVGAHLAGCPRCVAEWALLRAFENGTPSMRETEDVSWITARLRTRSPEIFHEARAGSEPQAAPASFAAKARAFFSGQRRGLSLWKPAYGWTAVAILLIAVAAPILLRQLGEPSIPGMVPQKDLVRSATLAVESPAGDVDAVPENLSWSRVEGAAAYQVRIFEVDHTEIWRSTVTQNSILLPEQIRSILVPGKKILWQVEAVDSAGRRIATSEVVHVKIIRARKTGLTLEPFPSFACVRAGFGAPALMTRVVYA